MGADQLADRHPLLDLGQPLDREDPQLAHIPRALAVRLARPGKASSSRVRATMSAGGARSSASEASSSTAKGTPASRAAATWRARLPSPKEGWIALGGARARAL